jgi:copper oxidase (laccase) domain-containing protein
MKYGLSSKPQDLRVVFQIPIRNPIIEKDWKQVIKSWTADSKDQEFSGCPEPANKGENISLSPDVKAAFLQGKTPHTEKYMFTDSEAGNWEVNIHPASRVRSTGLGIYVLMCHRPVESLTDLQFPHV